MRSRLLRLAGLVPVVVLYVGSGFFGFETWLMAASAISVLAWLIWAVIPDEPALPQQTSLLVMALSGGLASAVSSAGTIAVLVAVFATAATAQWSWSVVVVVAGAAAAATGVVAGVVGADPTLIVGQLAGIGVMVLTGWNRRQFQVTAEQNRLLVEQSRLLGAERDRAAAAAERNRIARDMHDVLAHTLGGLVVQLDAADALLEAGMTDEAAERVKTSHDLAVSGLGDARRVVKALRADWVDVRAELETLVEQHRSTSNVVDVEVVGDTEAIGEPICDALLRAAQESLSNARRHAAGKPVRLSVRVDAGGVALDVENPVGWESVRSRRGVSGWGLVGMRERITAVGGTVDAGRVGAKWLVRIAVPLS